MFSLSLLLEIALPVLGTVGFVVMSCVLLMAGYLVWVHRLYAHIPSPPRASFIFGHVPEFLAYQKKVGVENPLPLDLWFSWYENAGCSPVFVIFFMWRPFLLCLNPDDVKQLMMQPKYNKPFIMYKVFHYLCGVRFLKDGIFTTLDYKTWKPRRQIYDPAFNRSTLRGMIPSFNMCVDKFLADLKPLADGNTAAPMKDHISDLTMDVISKVAFSSDFSKLWNSSNLGLKHAKIDGSLHSLISLCFKGVQKQISSLFPYRYLHPLDSRQYAEAVQAVRMIGKDCIQRRITALENGDQMPNDILTHILRTAQVNESIDIEVLVDDFVTFYIAGQETTGNLLVFAVVMLLQHPDVLARLHEEIDEVLGDKQSVTAEDLDSLKYTEQVLLETLRMYPPVGGLGKETPKGGLVLSGYEVPGNTIVQMLTLMISRMSKYFEDPDVFNPDRFSPGKPVPSSFVFFPFGVGHRSCIGRHFALMEAKLALARLFQTYDLALPTDYKLIPVTYTTTQPADSVPCTLAPRHQ